MQTGQITDSRFSCPSCAAAVESPATLCSSVGAPTGRLVAGALWWCILAVLVAPLRAAPGDVRSSFDTPCKYPSGLATDGRHLFLADWRTAMIHEIEPANGTVLRAQPAPTLKPSGLAHGQGRLFVSDDHTGFIYSVNIENGVVESSFEAPAPAAKGLAWVDDTLFILAGDRIFQVLPGDGTILNSFPEPEKGCSSLAHDGNYLWVSNRLKDELYMVDPRKGRVIGILKAPGPYPAGLAWLEGCLWNVDFQTRKLYQMVIEDPVMYRLSEPRRACVEYSCTLTNYGPAGVAGLTLNIAVPWQLPQQRLLSKVEYSPPPSRTTQDRWGQPCAVFDLGDLAAGGRASAGYSVQAEISAIRFLIIPEKTGTLADIPAEIRQEYTVDATRLRLSSPYIQQRVKKIVGDTRNTYWIARKLYDFILDRVEYELAGGWDIPEVVLKRGKGSCSEYTYTFVALCRAAGLPARYQGSVVSRNDDAGIDDVFHRWAEIYLPSYGWVPVDVSRGDGPSPADQARGIGELANRFLITTIGGGDSEYLDWNYNSQARYHATGYAKIEEDKLAFWEPLVPTTQPVQVEAVSPPGPPTR